MNMDKELARFGAGRCTRNQITDFRILLEKLENSTDHCGH